MSESHDRATQGRNAENGDVTMNNGNADDEDTNPRDVEKASRLEEHPVFVEDNDDNEYDDNFFVGGDVIEVSTDDVETRCGVFGCRPDFLQPLAKVGCFAGMYGFSGLVTSTLSVYVNSQVTTLERQFGFNSNQTGLIMAANDVGYLLCVLFVSYLASRLHIPKALGIMTIVFGISGLICCLPHFIFGATLNEGRATSVAPPNMTSSFLEPKGRAQFFGDLCISGNLTEDRCMEKKGSEESDKAAGRGKDDVATISLVIIFIGMMVQGFGKAPRNSYTVTYVDGNTKRTKTGFYMGIIITVGILGPALAFLIGGVFTRIYVTLEATDLHPKHPQWIGAWWLGYIVFGLLAFVVSLPLFCFPRKLPRNKPRIDPMAKPTEKRNKDESNELMMLGTGSNKDPKQHADHPKGPLESIMWYLKDFLSMCLRLWTNPVFVSVSCAACFLLFVVSGSSAYMPKYLETIFDLPAFKANYIMAGITLFASCLGTFIGGYLSKRYKMTAHGAVKFILVTITIALLSNLCGLIFKCELPSVHGGPRTPLECEGNCTCKDESFYPICGDDGRTYYSPCFAGCSEYQEGIYSNCSCIPGGGAVVGMCEYSCDHLYPYVIAMALRSLFGTLWIIPKLVIFIRCVSEKDKALAIGFSSFMTSLLGWMLGPIVIGNFIDTVCDIWDDKCGHKGRCLLYNNDNFRLKYHGYTSISLACAVACIVFANVYAWHTGCLLTEEEKRKKNDKKGKKDDSASNVQNTGNGRVGVKN